MVRVEQSNLQSRNVNRAFRGFCFQFCELLNGLIEIIDPALKCCYAAA
jgi:hypothetical protein